MKPIDVIILIIIIVSVIAIGYFTFWKYRKDPCRGCPYARHCSEPCDKEEKQQLKK